MKTSWVYVLFELLILIAGKDHSEIAKYGLSIEAHTAALMQLKSCGMLKETVSLSQILLCFVCY